MKILILQDDYPPRALGGAGAIAAALAEEYERQGHEVRIVSAENLPRYHERWRAYRSLYNPGGIAAVERALSEFKPDMVHAHNVHRYLSYASLRAAKRSGATVILTMHDVMSFHYGKLTNYRSYKISPWQQLRDFRFRYNPLRNVIIRWYLRSCDRIVAVSGALCDVLRANGIRVDMVIHNGIALDYGKVTPMPAEKTVLFVNGNLKGSRQFLAALSLTDLRALIVGERGDLPDVKNVTYLGRVAPEKMSTLYARASVVAVPSICFDSLPTVILEAFACGRPVVATYLGGAPEIVTEGTGFVIDPYDACAFANALRQTTAEMGDAAREHVREKFDLVKQAARYLTLVPSGVTLKK
jgi:glycosyltransferase involved in cell wall biosynthesis